MISAVVAVYNEPDVLEFRQRLVHVIANLPALVGGYEIVWVVGDPLSLAQLIACIPRNGSEKVLYERDRGLGRALTLGMQAAVGDWILTMDSDLQQLPEELPRLWKEASEQYCGSPSCHYPVDMIIGAKGGVDSRGRFKRLASKALYKMYRTRYGGLKVRDMGSNFRLYRAWIARNALDFSSAPNGYEFLQWSLVEAWRSGAVIVEVPTTFAVRKTGRSKMSIRREIKERFL